MPMPPIRHLLAAPLVVFGLAMPAAAFDPAAMTDAQRDAFRAEVRAYLLENPAVLLEAVAALEAQQAADQAVDDAALVRVNAEALFASPDDWVGGNPDGDVTLVEFIDYNCGFCKRAHPEVAQVLEFDPGVRLVIKELPILGPGSELAAKMAVAVLRSHGDDAYAELHDRLMTHRGEVSAALLDRVGAEMGLDMAKVRAEMDGRDVARVLEENRALAARLRLNGTPSFALPDRLVRGMLPAPALLDLVDEVRREG